MNFMKLSKSEILSWKTICIFGYLHYLKHLNKYITIHLINIIPRLPHHIFSSFLENFTSIYVPKGEKNYSVSQFFICKLSIIVASIKLNKYK